MGVRTPEGTAILDTTSIPATRALLPPRARGSVRVAARLRGDVTALADLHIAGSLKALFPQQRGQGLQAVLLNTAGGITGGDRFETGIDAAEGTRLTVTTQAAERIYRAQPGEIGHVTTHLTAAPGARLTWLPQETILYDGAALDRRLSIDAAPGARVIACETLVFGRRAMGETVRRLHLRDRIDLRVGGQLQFADRLRLDGDAEAQLQGHAVTGGGQAVASIVAFAPDIAARLEALRALLPDTGGVSALSGDLLVLRLVAEDAYALRVPLIPILRALTAQDLPRTWTI